MEIDKVNLVYFSPTHTTKKILEGISQGIPTESIEHFDLTLPEAGKGTVTSLDSELAIFGVPVYGGRVPLTALDRLQHFQGQDTPAVVVAVYGNREFEDALLELKDLAAASGFRPLAGGAFIGEHSFSREDLPIAEGRPDTADMDAAAIFGKQIAEKLKALSDPTDIREIDVPGNSPYKERGSRGPVSPITRADVCTQCGTCVEVCPAGAISIADEVVTDADRCTLCCACVKACPTGAKVMEDPNIQGVAQWLNSNFSKRKEPEIFL